MSRRIEVELTSERPDGTWTWRAAGARQPKGMLDGRLLHAGARVGEVVRAEADFDLDGITVTSVLPPKGERREAPRIEIIGPPLETKAVTLDRGEGTGGRNGDRRPHPPRPAGSGGARRGPGSGGSREGAGRPRPGGQPRAGGSEGREGARSEATSGRASDRSRPARPPRPQPAPRPKAKRLRPGRAHRDALLAELPHEQQPIAEQVLRGGMPAVRTALHAQNASARAEGKPEAPTTAVLAIAEALLPRVRVAEWLDRSEAALADVEDLALADLRSVVVSAGDVAREERTREPAARLREVLKRRTTEEHAAWSKDLGQSLESGRVVRALRLSSRSPRPGERLEPEVATRLAEAAGTAMTAEIAPDRWATLLDAVAYSTVRRSVMPAGVPAEPGEDLLAQVRKHAGRVPAIAASFGIEVPPGRGRPSKHRGAEVSSDRHRPAPEPATATTTGVGLAQPRPRRIPPPPSADSSAGTVPEPTTAATEPAASEPAATEPAASEPAATEPAASEPAASEPAAAGAPALTDECRSSPVSMSSGDDVEDAVGVE